MTDAAASPPARPLRLSERIEGAAAIALMALFSLLPIDLASGIGGFLARSIGPRLGISKRAQRNLELALPELSAPERAAVIRQMWDNLGRVMAEYPHLAGIKCFVPGTRLAIDGIEHLDAAIARGKPIIFIASHYGNWEVPGIAGSQYGLPLAVVYRAPNNPIVAALVERIRAGFGGGVIPKGAGGARQLIQTIKAKTTVCILIDQKMNDGIPVPFFGRDAWTASGAVELAIRYDCTILMARAPRIGGARFHLTISPLEIARTGDRHADVRTTLTRINQELERWIRADPGQWFWLHKRWPD
jgi:Kdo2-lipid IVA lauroyltransferase/acyltransferase